MSFSTYMKEVGKAVECITGDYQGTEQTVNALVLRVLQELTVCQENGKKLMWIGNGGSAAIASHSALDYFRTADFKSICFNDGPLLTCLGNDLGYGAVFEKPVQTYAEAGDMLFAISSSGRSENILRAVRAAKDKGCRVVTLSGFAADNPLRGLGDINFYVPSDRYGLVELAHGILCHGFLDLYMAQQKTDGETQR